MTIRRPWTKTEDDYLRKNYRHRTPRQIADQLRRSVYSVRHRAYKLKLKGFRTWLPEEDAVLRKEWGKTRTCILAKRLSRTPNALKLRAIKLKLDAEREYTAAEKREIRKLYPQHSAYEVAEIVLGDRSHAKNIWKMAQRLGIKKTYRIGKRLIQRIAKLHGQGQLDAAIARKLHLQRRTVCDIRANRLKLPVDPEAIRASRRQSVLTQYKRLGIQSGGELRRYAHQKFATDNGWPKDLRPREVQILHVLARRGPMTRMEIATRLGMRTDRIGVEGRPVLLAGNGPGGSYTATLMRHGFIAAIRRFTRGRGKGRNRLPNLYMLTAKAIEVFQKQAEKRNEQTDPARSARFAAVQ